ncbi:MAG: polysaccharide biosynthesis/export family protein [Planctomycetes bacterium]|nr:polysaccharide biosynthesis/export family protein [Planctomycetota bacterium]
MKGKLRPSKIDFGERFDFSVVGCLSEKEGKGLAVFLSRFLCICGRVGCMSVGMARRSGGACRFSFSGVVLSPNGLSLRRLWIFLTGHKYLYKGHFPPEIGMLSARSIIVLAVWALVSPSVSADGSGYPPARRQYGESSDFVELKSKERLSTQEERAYSYDFSENRESGRSMRDKRNPHSQEKGLRVSHLRGNIRDLPTVTSYRVLKDDQIVEVRNPRTGKTVITVVRAAALPEEELNRFDLQYTLMDLDQISVQVKNHDEEVRNYRVPKSGLIDIPLIGQVMAKGVSVTELQDAIAEKYKEFIKNPVVSVSITEKSPLAKILVVGRGFINFNGYEKILDVLGAGWQPSVENIYDKHCVIRKQHDGSMKCIVVDMEYMFKTFDFTQNIPLKAGDVILIKKMPPLFGYRFKFWWQQILSWMNEIDEFGNALQSIQDFELSN